MSALNTENKQIKQSRSHYPICHEQLLLSAISFLFVTLLRYFFSPLHVTVMKYSVRVGTKFLWVFEVGPRMKLTS